MCCRCFSLLNSLCTSRNDGYLCHARRKAQCILVGCRAFSTQQGANRRICEWAPRTIMPSAACTAQLHIIVRYTHAAYFLYAFSYAFPNMHLCRGSSSTSCTVGWMK